MNTKKLILSSLGVSIIFVLAYLAIAELVTSDIPISTDILTNMSPASGVNISGGNYNMSARLNTSNNWTFSVTNITFTWRLANSSYAQQFSSWNGNISVMANVTIKNDTTGQSNHSFNKSFNTATLPDGVYNISLIICNFTLDSTGSCTDLWNVSTPVIVDNTKPAVSPVALASSYLYNYTGNITLNVSIKDLTMTGCNAIGDGTTTSVCNLKVIFSIDNATGADGVCADGNCSARNYSGHWSWQQGINISSLHAGTHTITIIANDSANNSNGTQTWTFTLMTPLNVTWDASYNGAYYGPSTGSPQGQNFTLGVTNVTVFNVSVSGINRSSHQNRTIQTNAPLITDVIFMITNASSSANNGKDVNLTNSTNSTGLGSGAGRSVNSSVYFNLSINLTTFYVGTHYVTIFANDSLGNYNHTEQIWFTILNSPQNVTFNTINSSQGANWSLGVNNATFINVTVTNALAKTGLLNIRTQNVTLMFDNASKGPAYNLSSYPILDTVVIDNNGRSFTIHFNLSHLYVGTHYVTIFANDSLGNYNHTEQIWFTVLNSPHNVTWNIYGGDSKTGLINRQNFSAINSSVVFNVTIRNATDPVWRPYMVNTAGARVLNVTFYFDNASGTGFNRSANLSLSHDGMVWGTNYNVSALEEGTNTVTIFANDTLGNYNNTEFITFMVDKTAPTITVSCSPSTPTAGQTVACTCTAADATNISVQAAFGNGGNSESTTASSTVGTYSSSTCSATDYAGNRGEGTGSWTVTSSSSSGGGGPAGGGGGVGTGVTGVFEKKVWASINAGETATLEVKNGEIGVTEISFNVKDTTYGAWLKIEKKDSLPSNVKEFTGDASYKINSISENNIENVIDGTVTVKFKVAKSWLTENGLSKTEAAYFRYAGDKWNKLETTVGQDDGTYIHYTAETPGFSYFIIGGAKGEITPVATAEETAEEVTGATAEEKVTTPTSEEAVTAAEEVAKGKPVWPWVVLVIVVIGLIGLLYWLKTKK